MNLTNDWFYNQHYSKEELETLQGWIDKAGNEVIVRQTENGRWSGFHILDTEFTIDLAGQKTEDDCKNWMPRLGLKVRSE